MLQGENSLPPDDFCQTLAVAGTSTQKKKSPGDAGAFLKIDQAFAFS
jgi:hypothetical protein